MILSKSELQKEISQNIFISPFDEKKLNSNSYNLTLSDTLLIYNDAILDMKKDNPYTKITIPPDGIILQPNRLYLGCTNEVTFTKKFVPRIEGRSSLARLGLFVHICAGLGEAGFHGKWTLELSCVQPIKIYPNTDICQIYFSPIYGDIDLCASKKYQHNTNVQTSKLYQEFEE